MLEESKLQEAEKRAKQYLSQRIVSMDGKRRHIPFFLKNAQDALDSAQALFIISTDSKQQHSLGFTSFDGFLWVVNASYYSMFYMARAFLDNEGISIKTDHSVHAITFDILVSQFYLTGKLQRRLLEDLARAKEDADELLGKQKADGLIEDYFFEKGKRATFTYEMGTFVIRSRAKTSLERARKFFRELRKLIPTK